MKKYYKFEEKKEKCPFCGNDLNVTVEVESKVLSLSTSPWVDIKKAEYDNTDEIFFSEVDNEKQPHKMHRVRVVDKQNKPIPWIPIYTDRSFNDGTDPGPIGCRFIETGIWQLTKDNVLNGTWHWEVELKPAEFPT
jgi:hypothetical protein